MTRQRIIPLLTAILLALPLSPAADASRRGRPPAGPVPTPATIRGTVRAGARPPSSALVRLLNTDRSTRTGSSGQFAFHNLHPGTYTVFASTRHHGSARATVSVKPGQSRNVVLSIRPHRHHPRRGF